ncbi:hypothetical protein [uncultured Bosea sp.]|uniref:hypothetical protein n=1 Tax=uncultured Bosea sp. TaxID=211457 RepID=UPI0025D388AF|nr:hypothetical protein [uncultured Bosea sp.]
MTDTKNRTDNAEQPDIDETLSINPDHYIGEERQQELIALADAGNGASAVRLAIREAVAAFRRQMLLH